jgi:energy-coupling factor transport system permease protein
MMYRSFIEADSPLHRLNPAVKLLTFSLLLVAPTLFLDPFTPGSFLLLSVLIAWFLGGISPWSLARRQGFFLAVAAGILVFCTLFYGGARHELLLQIGPFLVHREALSFGLGICLRLLCVISYSSLFVRTTDPSLLVGSLIHQARLPRRVAYSVLAAFRFLPLLQQEAALIRDAHRLRGGYREGLLARLAGVRRLGIPLLAGGIRQAERLAMSMDARGFSFPGERTYYRRPVVRAADCLFLAGMSLAAAGLVAALLAAGLARGFLAGVVETQVQDR